MRIACPHRVHGRARGVCSHTNISGLSFGVEAGYMRPVEPIARWNRAEVHRGVVLTGEELTVGARAERMASTLSGVRATEGRRTGK